MKRFAWAVCYGLSLLAFTAYISLDTFVISSSYQESANELNTSMFDSISRTDIPSQEELSTEMSEDDASSSQAAESQVNEKHSGKHSRSTSSADSSESTVQPGSTELTAGGTVYSDDNILIDLSEYYEYDTKIYVADIYLSSAEYLKTAFADDTYGKNVTAKTSQTAAEHNAILAINGDYYGARERGYVIRNGVVYRSTPSSDELLCIYADGTMEVVSQYDYSAEELAERGVWQAFCFGPGLLSGGSITVSENDEVGKAMASNPRTAIGMISANHFVMVVSDGRTNESEGLSLYQLAQFMQQLGIDTAYNLDGGGSSTMCLNGEVINNPTSNGSIKERKVSDIVYIG